MRRSCVVLAVILAAWLPARADVAADLAAIDARLKACIAKDDTNAGMQACTGDALTAADKALNALYRSVVTKLKQAGPDSDAASDAETLKRLTAAERAWIGYRDAECALQGTQMLGGSGEGLVIVDCRFSMTKERIKSLDALFSPR